MLTVKEMAKIAEIDVEIIQRLVTLGFIQKHHREEGRRIQAGLPPNRFTVVPAAEVFRHFWQSPFGKTRLANPNFRAEIGLREVKR
jgi:hypothetical protein